MIITRVVACGGMILALAGIAATPMTHAVPPRPSPGQDGDIRLRRIAIVDAATPEAHAWAVSRDSWSVYSSLYSHHLRDLLSHQRAGTMIWLDTNPAAPVVIGQPSPDAAEVRDFSAFCKAQRLRFSFAPVS